MKNLLLILTVLCSCALHAQNYCYDIHLRDGAKWKEICYASPIPIDYDLELKGDTIINDTTYLKMYGSIYDSPTTLLNEDNTNLKYYFKNKLIALMRNKEGVFYIRPFYSCCALMVYHLDNEGSLLEEEPGEPQLSEEKLLYTFNTKWNENDTVCIGYNWNKVDTLVVNSDNYNPPMIVFCGNNQYSQSDERYLLADGKYYKNGFFNYTHLIFGIGSENGILSNLFPGRRSMEYRSLRSFYDNGILIYDNDDIIYHDYQGISEISSESSPQVACSANTSTHQLSFIFSNSDAATYVLDIFSLEGHLIKSIAGVNSGNSTINASFLSSGTYLYRLHNTAKSYTGKFTL